MDAEFVEDPDDWWEHMVAKLVEEHGEINLC